MGCLHFCVIDMWESQAVSSLWWTSLKKGLVDGAQDRIHELL